MYVGVLGCTPMSFQRNKCLEAMTGNDYKKYIINVLCGC